MLISLGERPPILRYSGPPGHNQLQSISFLDFGGYTRRAPLALTYDKMMGKSGKYRRRWGIKSPGDLGSIIPAAASEPAGGKKTCAQCDAGFALDGNDWDGIYAGRRKRMDLVYAGEVDHGFDRTRTAD